MRARWGGRYLLRAVALSLLLVFAATANANAAAPLPVTQIAPGLYVHRGQDEVATRANKGDIANIGFVVGKRCVAVIDTGGTAAEGRALRAAIRAVTRLPVCYVINTHMHPDHILGNVAFRDDHPQFVGSATLAEAEASHAESYMRRQRNHPADADRRRQHEARPWRTRPDVADMENSAYEQRSDGLR